MRKLPPSKSLVMKKLIKPSSLLLYLLALVVFLMVGMVFAGITGVAKGQGLAGGAIVLGYGVMFGFIALVISFFIAYHASHRVIKNINRVLAIALIIAAGIFTYRFMMQEGATESIEETRPTTTPATKVPVQTLAAGAYQPLSESTTPLGLGFFMPNFYDNPALYFYGNPNFEKSIQEHSPTDSIVFTRLEQGGFDISYAPPWLVPDHLKLDYDMLYFRMQSIGRDFVEVTVNTRTKRIAYVSRYAGKIVYWPDFMLLVNSVEFISPLEQQIHVKPLKNAGIVNISFAFMSPIMIKDNWMKVDLMDDDYKKVGQGWVLWKKDNELLVSYSLLS